MNNMRRGFTMIEIIFVIVIIGILTAVAIPKIAASRDDAIASTCVHDVGQFISEVTSTYTKVGYTEFITRTGASMTNIFTADTITEGNGIRTSTAKIDTAGIAYVCDGHMIVSFTGANAGPDYNLTVLRMTGSLGSLSPAASKASTLVKENILGGNESRIYPL